MKTENKPFEKSLKGKPDAVSLKQAVLKELEFGEYISDDAESIVERAIDLAIQLAREEDTEKFDKVVSNMMKEIRNTRHQAIREVREWLRKDKSVELNEYDTDMILEAFDKKFGVD